MERSAELDPLAAGGVERLNARRESLATMPEWSVGSPAGTLLVLSDKGGIRVDPTRGRALHVTFGRQTDDVHVPVGTHDPGVSRLHGRLHWADQHWNLTNVGRTPIRMRESLFITPGELVRLPEGYSPLFVLSTSREHLLEVLVVGAGHLRAPAPGHPTTLPAQWALTVRERLVMVALGQAYLRFEAAPQPLSWRTLTDQLHELDPSAGWTPKRAEYVVARLRARLVHAGVPGLRREEIAAPIGNSLNHNLILELLKAGSIAPPDLALLDPLGAG